MFKPSYRITDYFLSAIEQISALRAVLSKSSAELPALRQLQRDVFNENVHSSTTIEGNSLSLNQVAQLSEQKDVRGDSRQKLEVTNYIEALRWITDHAEKEINERDLLRAHRLITNGLVDRDKCGKYREAQNFVVDGSGVVVYRPPAASEVTKLMSGLFEWVSENSETHAVIAGSVFHHQIVSIHPFTDGNGRIARGAGLWLLYQRDYDPLHILAIDRYFANDRQKYYAKIQQARDLDYDLTYWLEYVAQGVWETMSDAVKKLSQPALPAGQAMFFTPKQEEVIDCIRDHPGCGSKVIGASLGINRARVNQLVSPLVKAGTIKVSGRARATRYFIA